MRSTPRTGNTSLSCSAQGRCGGTGTVPSVIGTVLVVHFNAKGIHRSRFILIPATSQMIDTGECRIPRGYREKKDWLLIIDLSSIPFPDDMGPAGRSKIIGHVPGIPGTGTVHISIPDTILVDP